MFSLVPNFCVVILFIVRQVFPLRHKQNFYFAFFRRVFVASYRGFVWCVLFLLQMRNGFGLEFYLSAVLGVACHSFFVFIVGVVASSVDLLVVTSSMIAHVSLVCRE